MAHSKGSEHENCTLIEYLSKHLVHICALSRTPCPHLRGRTWGCPTVWNSERVQISKCAWSGNGYINCGIFPSCSTLEKTTNLYLSIRIDLKNIMCDKSIELYVQYNTIHSQCIYRYDFIKTYFTYHTIHSFKVYNSEALGWHSLLGIWLLVFSRDLKVVGLSPASGPKLSDESAKVSFSLSPCPSLCLLSLPLLKINK